MLSMCGNYKPTVAQHPAIWRNGGECIASREIFSKGVLYIELFLEILYVIGAFCGIYSAVADVYDRFFKKEK